MMQVRLLPAPFINKKFIVGEAKCNYELYLLELINRSAWFSDRFPGGFFSPDTEANGEYDANNEYYQLDFKLFVAESALRAQNLLSSQIIKIGEGISILGDSRSPDSSFEVTRLYAAFRGKSIDELYSIRCFSKERYSVDSDINAALKVLETRKNILLFFPYVFSLDGFENADYVPRIIGDVLKLDFLSAFLYRSIVARGFDTFITCLYNDSFLIFKVDSDKMELCDMVQVNKCLTFQELKNYTQTW